MVGRKKADVLNTKIRNNMGMVRERIDVLRKLVGDDSVSTTSRASTLASTTSTPPPTRKPRKAVSMPLRQQRRTEPPKANQEKKENDGQDEAFLKQIRNEILIEKPNVTWSDVTGLQSAKQVQCC